METLSLAADHRLTALVDPGSRPHISVPYNFQHLTHTHSRQFKSLDKASEEELASELSAIQTAQTPQRRLQGIAAQDLSAPSSACPSPSRQAPSSPVLLSPSSIYSTSSRFEQGQLQSPLRTPSDQDYFSHHNSHFANSPEGTVVPPRKSSRAARHIEFYSQLLQEENIHSHDKQSPGLETPVDSNISPYFTAPQTPLDGSHTTWAIPHAMTTPDDSAYIIPPASRHASLADVPEEDDSKSTMIRDSQPSTPGAGLRHTKSFPNASPLTWQQAPHSPILGNLLTFSAFGGVDRILPALINQSHDNTNRNNRQSRQMPCSPLSMDASWEDDIDFCYEHAAEANCDFDWTRPSLDDRVHNAENDESPSEASVEKPKPLRIKQRSCSSPQQLPRLQTSISMSNLSLTNSANSSIVSVAGPITPANPYILSVTGKNRKASIAPQVYESECFNDVVEPEHPIPIEADFKHPSEELFALHTFRFDPPPVEDDSPRSSRSPISKANSYESFWSSRPSYGLKDKGNNISTDSLPDLVKSKRDAASSLQGKKSMTTTSRHHTRAKSEAIKSTATLSAASQAMRRKRSASSSRGSAYSLFPQVPAMKVIQ